MQPNNVLDLVAPQDIVITKSVVSGPNFKSFELPEHFTAKVQKFLSLAIIKKTIEANKTADRSLAVETFTIIGNLGFNANYATSAASAFNYKLIRTAINENLPNELSVEDTQIIESLNESLKLIVCKTIEVQNTLSELKEKCTEALDAKGATNHELSEALENIKFIVYDKENAVSIDLLSENINKVPNMISLEIYDKFIDENIKNMFREIKIAYTDKLNSLEQHLPNLKLNPTIKNLLKLILLDTLYFIIASKADYIASIINKCNTVIENRFNMTEVDYEYLNDIVYSIIRIKEEAEIIEETAACLESKPNVFELSIGLIKALKS